MNTPRILTGAALAALLTIGAMPVRAGDEEPRESTGQEAEDTASAVMSQPLDGSSQEAFDASLARVETDATPDEYARLKNALGMMSAYDLAIRSNPSLLPQRVDGKTPSEVVQMAKDRWKL